MIAEAGSSCWREWRNAREHGMHTSRSSRRQAPTTVRFIFGMKVLKIAFRIGLTASNEHTCTDTLRTLETTPFVWYSCVHAKTLYFYAEIFENVSSLFNGIPFNVQRLMLGRHKTEAKNGQTLQIRNTLHPFRTSLLTPSSAREVRKTPHWRHVRASSYRFFFGSSC